MKQPLPFSTSEPLKLGNIYVIGQGNNRRAVTKGSAGIHQLSINIKEKSLSGIPTVINFTKIREI